MNEFGVVAQVPTDQGTRFKPVIGELSKFTYCGELGIRHITAGRGRPTAIGKTENPQKHM